MFSTYGNLLPFTFTNSLEQPAYFEKTYNFLGHIIFVYNFGIRYHFTEIFSILILIMAMGIAYNFQVHTISNKKVIKRQTSVRNTLNYILEP